MDRIHFPYRSSTHLPFLHVVAECGAWEKHGLDVIYDEKVSSQDAHRDVPTGDIEFVGGNHVSTYGHRARGDSWVYLGQTVNQTNFKLITKEGAGVSDVADLKGKRVGSSGNHPTLNVWLFLRQHGLDVDRDDVAIVKPEHLTAGSKKVQRGVLDLIADGDVEAGFVIPPETDFAAQRGLKVIDVQPLPMIWFTTLSSSLTFVERHPDIVERFIKGIAEGIAFFKTQPDKAIKIIQERYTNEGILGYEAAAKLHTEIAQVLEPKLYPTLTAIANVYEEAIRQDKDSERVNPMALWDLHHIRKIDDTGWFDALYGGRAPEAKG